MQKQIIIATSNKAKILQIQGALKPLDISVIGLQDGISLSVKEDGKTIQENAQKKATAYARFLNRQVLSMDNALYFDGLADELQPGINVRRIKGEDIRPNDSELLKYYSDLIVKHFGEQGTGYWEFAICIVDPGGAVFGITIVSPRIFTSQASFAVIDGYPIESLQIDPKTGKYISEMSQDEQDKFWQDAIGKELCDFVKNILSV